MSLKVKPIETLIPDIQTQDKFVVVITDMPNTLWCCYDASLPFETRNTLEVPVRGRNIPMPGLRTRPGTWSCTLYESAIATSATMLQVAKRKQVLLEQIQSHYHRLTDVIIYITDKVTGLAPVYWYVLHDAWIKKVDPLPLNWNGAANLISFKVTFEYSRITRSYMDDTSDDKI